MQLILIAALDQRGAIGHEGKLLFWLPNDLKRFKALTTGHTILMGRKTFESLPNGALPNRRNIVLSHNTSLELAGAEVFSSLNEALASCAQDEIVYVIGGAQIYAETIGHADGLCITQIEATAPLADVFFPTIDDSIWKINVKEPHLADEKHLHAYCFTDYIRR